MEGTPWIQFLWHLLGYASSHAGYPLPACLHRQFYPASTAKMLINNLMDWAEFALVCDLIHTPGLTFRAGWEQGCT